MGQSNIPRQGQTDFTTYTKFESLSASDPGALPERPFVGRFSQRITALLGLKLQLKRVSHFPQLELQTCNQHRGARQDFRNKAPRQAIARPSIFPEI